MKHSGWLCVSLILAFMLSPLHASVILIPSDTTVAQGQTGSTEGTPIIEPVENFEELFPADQDEALSCGCYIVNPEILGLKYRKAMVPLRHIDYDIEIVNSLVHLTLQQQYENPSSRFLTVRYSFPIQPDSSLYKFEARFGNVVVVGVVKEKEQAKREFEQAKSEGRQAVLVTQDVNSKDIINMEIGNIPPRTKVQITISLVQELTLGMNMFYRLQVPSTISPRYMNSAPNAPAGPREAPAASTVASPMSTILRAVDKPDYTWSFLVTVRGGKKLVFYNSPSHKLVKTSTSEDETVNVFTLEKEAVPNKDFVFVYTPEDFELPNFVLGENENSTTVMVSFIPKFSELKFDEAYANLQRKKEQEFDVNSVKGEYIFILDRSGSMDGSRIIQARQSLVIFLRSLPADSFFNIISFGSAYEKMFPESIRYENKQIKEAIAKVQQMEADFGGTEIYYPLEDALKQPVMEEYPRFVFLLTDGSVSDTENVILMAKKKSRLSRISTIGIGNGASLRLIEGCAEAGRGKYAMISDDENPAEKIISLLKSSLTPLIRKIALNYDRAGLQSIIPNPVTLPYILKDSIVNFYLTYAGSITEPKTVSLEYEDSVSKKVHRSEVVITTETQSYPYVDKMAHFKVLRVLEDLSKDNDAKAADYIDYKGQVKDYKQEAVDYSVKYQVLSEYTAFIAVGRELVDREKNLFRELGSQLVEVQQTKPVQYVEESVAIVTAAPIFPAVSAPSSSGPIVTAMAMPIQMSLPPQPPSYQPQTFADPGMAPPIQYDAAPVPVPEEPVFAESLAIENGKISQDAVQIVTESPKLSPTDTNNAPPSNEQKPKATIPVITEKKVTIDDVVDMQNISGEWSDESLIQKLAKDPAAASKLAAEIGKEVVLTKLALLWLQKQQAGAQYSLIIKKAEGWLAKKIADDKIDVAKLDSLEVL